MHIKTGVIMPKHHKAKCSWKDCSVGHNLKSNGICINLGMWWHPACPCWSEESSKFKNNTLTLFAEEQLIKNKIGGVIKHLTGNDMTNYDALLKASVTEYKSLLAALSISKNIDSVLLLQEIKKHSEIELLITLLLIKVGMLDLIVAEMYTEE